MPTGRLSMALVEHHPAETRGAPGPHDARIGDDVERHRPQKVHGLVDRAHRPVAVPGRRGGDRQGGVGKCRQRLRAHHAALATDAAATAAAATRRRAASRWARRRAGWIRRFRSACRGPAPTVRTPRAAGAPPPAGRTECRSLSSRRASSILVPIRTRYANPVAIRRRDAHTPTGSLTRRSRDESAAKVGGNADRSSQAAHQAVVNRAHHVAGTPHRCANPPRAPHKS